MVGMAIDNKYAPLIHNNASLLLRPKTGLNDMVVEVDPGTQSAPQIKEDSTVPLASTQPQVNPDEFLASLDGDRIGDLLFSERLDRQIAPGPHHLRVHNTLFWKNLHFDAAPGETVHFEVVNYAGRGFLSLVLIIGAAPLFLAVERKTATTEKG